MLIYVWATEPGRMLDAGEEVKQARLALEQVATAPGAALATKAAQAPTAAATPAAQQAAGADAAAAHALFKAKACIGCHVAPGIPEAVGTTGPNLGGIASRPQISAGLPLNADNLKKWLKDPPAVKPGTLMPNLGLSDADIETLVAWILTLK